jgi:hypothetical protein
VLIQSDIEVLTAVKMSVVFWIVTSSGLVGSYQRFGETYRQLQGGVHPFLRNFDNHLEDHIASQPEGHDRKCNLAL